MKKKSKLGKNWFEWIVFGIGLALVLATLGYLAYDAATITDAPPSIEVRTGEAERREHNFIIPVTLINHGDRTAEGVQVEVVLESGGTEQERGEFTVAFLPRRSTREGWVAFQTDPGTAERIKARVTGYEKP
ncbi:MAG TPA: hypothetical protein VJT09_09645 [Pyrinomonadaceae bacterium]|nr:hypothetical protein [Pyrinomonadaceae bacterium]